jgi:predicted MPP superfamily phosphohydrolase
VVVAGGLVVAGVDDPTFLGGRDKLADAMATAVAGRPEGLPVVLLSHQPLALEAAANLGVGLVLCGHTHGGQIPPFQVLNRIAYSFIRGLHRVGDMQVYVSNGSGYWGPPVRVFADPEVVRVTLRAL